MWSTCGQSGYITPAVLGVPHAKQGKKNKKQSYGPHVGKVATSPLQSWESPTLSAGTKVRSGYVAHMWGKLLHDPCSLGGPGRSAGTKVGNAIWPTCGQSGYITPPVLRGPNAERGDKRQKLLSGPHVPL